MKHTCTACGHQDEINAASIMGKQKKTMSPAAIAQRQAAGEATRAKWAAIKKLKEDGK